MALLSVIRRWAFRDQLSIRAISRRTGLSRNTIRKYLRSGAVEPKFAVPERPSKIDPFADKLSHWLRVEAGKSRKQKRTIKQLHADLVALGYDGSYGRVAAFVREWKVDRQRAQQTTGRGVFVPLAFQAGEAFQFDWSEDWAILGGERTKLQVAHFKLSHSRAFILRAYHLQTHEMLFDAHIHAFRVLGGVPQRGIYDNMKTAVGTSNYTYAEARWSEGLADWIGAHVNALAFLGGVPKLLVCDNLRAGVTTACRYEPGINRTYQEMAAHYGTAVLPTRVRRPRNKAKVEVAVLIVERFILARLRHRRFLSLGELNEAIREVLGDLNDRLMRKLGASRRAFFETIDRPVLLALPAEPYAYAEWRRCRVAPDYHVEVHGHFYSVPSRLIREVVEAVVDRSAWPPP